MGEVKIDYKIFPKLKLHSNEKFFKKWVENELKVNCKFLIYTKITECFDNKSFCQQGT